MWLLSVPLSLNRGFQDQRTPLSLAAEKGKEGVVRLLEGGADREARNEVGGVTAGEFKGWHVTMGWIMKARANESE